MQARTRFFDVGRRAWLYALVLVVAIGFVAQGSSAQPPAPEKADVTLHEHPVFSLHRGDGTRTVSQRAQHASGALSEALEAATADQVTVARRGERAVIAVGPTPVVELVEEDARLAGDSSLEVHAASVAARIRRALTQERQRSRVANSVFSASLVVFFGLVTLYLVRKLHELSLRARHILVRHPHRVPALRLQRLEVMGPAALRSVLLLVVSLGHGLGMLGLAYTWLVLSLSLFVPTRPYVEQLTGFVLSPASSLVGRIASALPLFVVVLIAGGLVAVIFRIAELFFASIARGETKLAGLDPELAQATSTLVRAGLVIFAMVFAGPVITGDPDGSIARTGTLVLLSLALASTPLLASIVAGVALAFSRSLRAGDQVEYGGRTGRVRELGVVTLVLEGQDGSTIRVPHVLSLWHPTRILDREATP